MVGDEFEVVLQACEMVVNNARGNPIGNSAGNKRGRKPYPRTLLTAVIYLTLKEGWSLRQAERWCEENLELLRQHGWTYRNSPKKSTLHNVMREMDAATLQRITAAVKSLKREVPFPLVYKV